MSASFERILEINAWMNALYAEHCTGCCLHIVLDDGNLEDAHLTHCIDWALQSNHPACVALGLALFELSPTQRRKLYRRGYDRAERHRHAMLRRQLRHALGPIRVAYATSPHTGRPGG